MPPFQTGRSRPNHLSDPDGEIGSARIEEVLSTLDIELNWRHFRALLGPFSTAGTYEEVVYFLPLAFERLLSRDDEALDLVTTPIWFASQFEIRLRKDRLHNSVRDCIRECLKYWTKDFQITHLDRDAGRQDWGVRYVDNVVHSEVICQCNCDLVSFKTHSDLAVEFTLLLANHEKDLTKASWFLEYSAARAGAYTPPNDQQILSILGDRKLLERAASAVCDHLTPDERKTTYWNDLFVKLELWEFLIET